MKPVIAITMGDPGGVGPEVILKALGRKWLPSRAEYRVYGARAVFEACSKRRGLAMPRNFLDVCDTKSRAVVGKVSKANAAMAWAALEAATRDAVKGRVQAVVTAPVHKTSMRLLDRSFQGHTEFLAKRSRVRHYAMMFVSKRLKVTLVTIHVPLQKVSSLISRKVVLEKIRLTHTFLKKHFRLGRPRIAVCALNPHGEETGKEERAKILPAVRKACEERIRVVGPKSADQLFYDAYEGRFDAVVSMYHDQGLAPFKMIAFHDGVNTTLGLPFVRTSPDHGTAFDIAGRGVADPRSMTAALTLAEQLIC